MFMFIFKASDKISKNCFLQKHNFLLQQTLRHRTKNDPRFFRKIKNINMFFKAIYEEQQKIKLFGKITNCLNHSPQTV